MLNFGKSNSRLDTSIAGLKDYRASPGIVRTHYRDAHEVQTTVYPVVKLSAAACQLSLVMTGSAADRSSDLARDTFPAALHPCLQPETLTSHLRVAQHDHGQHLEHWDTR